MVVLTGCASADYKWGWTVLSPLTKAGQDNLSFLATGFGITIGVSLSAISLSLIAGLGLAFLMLSSRPTVRGITRSFVEAVRAVPILVMLLWVYYGLPVISGIVLDRFVSGVLALALCDCVFEAEIFRAGIQSVPKSQREGGAALGLSPYQRARLIILPQAIRYILPAIGNQFVYILKMSSLVSVIGLADLTRRATELNVNLYRPLEVYTVLILEYLLLIIVISYAVSRLERYLWRHQADERTRS
ncbi:MAG: amino acid ABC transporter permease [Pseudomonadota bacterium]